METANTKHCPLCNTDLEVNAFGICRSRKDGHNLYCKSCVRERMAKVRIGQKNWRQVKKERQARAIEAAITQVQVMKPSAEDQVIEALSNGARTQREIQLETRLTKDEIADVICSLLLWRRVIRTVMSGETRMYFLKAA